MADPTPAVIAWIAARSPDWSADNAAVRDALNAPTVPNPAPRGTVPRVLSAALLASHLDAAAMQRLRSFPSLARLLDDVVAQNRPGVDLWRQLLTADGTLTADQSAAIAADLMAADPDPDWSATVPAAVADLGRLLDIGDVAAARAALAPGG